MFGISAAPGIVYAVAGGSRRGSEVIREAQASTSVPARAGETAFRQLCDTIQKERIRLFEAVQKPFTPKLPQKAAGDGDLVAFIPDEDAAGDRGVSEEGDADGDRGGPEC